MKGKKTIKTITEEVIANGIGWVAGLLSIDLLNNFFVAHRWWQVWHLFSGKTRITPALFSFLEWTLTAIIGFAVMIIVNKYVRKKFFKKETLEKVKKVIKKDSVDNQQTNNDINKTETISSSEQTIENSTENTEIISETETVEEVDNLNEEISNTEKEPDNKDEDENKII